MTRTLISCMFTSLDGFTGRRPHQSAREIREAIHRMESGEVLGKVVITV